VGNACAHTAGGMRIDHAGIPWRRCGSGPPPTHSWGALCTKLRLGGVQQLMVADEKDPKVILERFEKVYTNRTRTNTPLSFQLSSHKAAPEASLYAIFQWLEARYSELFSISGTTYDAVTGLYMFKEYCANGHRTSLFLVH